MNKKLSEGNILRAAKEILVIAGMAALVLVCSGPTLAQSKQAQSSSATSAQVAPANPAPVTQATTPKPTADSPAPEEQSESKGQPGDVKIHGHWVIEVKNPDGTLVSHTEFENSLVNSSGYALMAGILSQNLTPGPWFIQIVSTPTAPLCFGSTLIGSTPPPAGVCALLQVGPVQTGFTVCPVPLSPTNCLAGMPGPNVNLSGNTVLIGGNFTLPTASAFPAVGTGVTITQVLTGLGTCPATTTVAACIAPNATFSGPSLFTSATSATSPAFAPVFVAAGQIAQVSVTFSFASSGSNPARTNR
jgi:hypothetical protein